MRLLLICALLGLPAFFAASEVAILRLRPSRVQRLVEEAQPGAIAIKRLQRRLRKALMVSQLGTTLSLIALGWIGPQLGHHWFPVAKDMTQFRDGSIFLLIVFLTTLIAGLIPKALVLNRPETAALQLSPILEAVMKTMAPVLGVLESIASLLLGLMGLTTKWDSLVPALSAGELETLIESGGVTGLRPDERNILEGVFALRDTQVREVMIPRAGMVTLPIEVCFAELMEAVHQTKHARFLVTGESLDDIKGLLDLRQLAEAIAKGNLQANSQLEPYLQSVPRVLETSTLSELLPLIKSGNPLLLVVDEHGGTEGLVTAADLTGEIVGDELEANKNQKNLESIDGYSDQWSLAGDLEIIELNKQLNLELPEADDHHTIAGFLLEKFQHVPLTGETLNYEDLLFEITIMKGPRIDRVKLFIANPDTSGDANSVNDL